MAASTPGADADTPIDGVSIDTRTLAAGDLFFALRGDPGPRFNTSAPGTRDGHDFVAAAFEAGAAAAVVHTQVDAGGPHLRVTDTLDALWDLARASVARHQGQRFAITGSSGKTTAKAFLSRALAAVLEPGSLNNFWGVPLCLARTRREASHAVFEVGTNGPGEIGPLSTLVSPQVAVLLNVHPAHIGNFADLDALTSEKLAIAAGLGAGGRFVCPVALAQAAPGLAPITFGPQRDATVRTLDVDGDRGRYDCNGVAISARVPGGGAHRAETLGAVMAALIGAGLDPRLATDLDAELVPTGRGNAMSVTDTTGRRYVVIDDSYNANPASMAAALRGFAVRPGPRVAILGEMLELGDDAERYHRALAKDCDGLDALWCVGDGARALFDALPASLRQRDARWVATVDELDLNALARSLPVGASVLVKGSNRVFWQHGFCDRLVRAIGAV